MNSARIIRYLVHFALLLCFIAQIWETMSKYLSKQTLNIEEKVGAESMRMPDITLCSAKPYKSPGFHFNKTAFDRQTYTFDEIFFPETVDNLKAKNFSIRELFSESHGRCFVLSSEHRFRSPSEHVALLFRPDNPGVIAFFHEPRAELLVALDSFIPGAPVESEQLGEDHVACLIELELYIFLEMWDGQYSCQEYGDFNEAFYPCAKEKLQEAIARDKKFSCSTVWYEDYFPLSSQPCNYERDFPELIRMGKWSKNNSEFISDFPANSGSYGCARPCRWYRYRAKCKDAKKEMNSYLEILKERGMLAGIEQFNEDAIKVTLGMNLMEETESQQLLYGISELIAAIGGSLGLFLGFSVLHCMDIVIEKANVFIGTRDLK